jgi:hypothetical protein
MCSIQFHFILIFLDIPNGISNAKLKNNEEKASPCFTPFTCMVLDTRSADSVECGPTGQQLDTGSLTVTCFFRGGRYTWWNHFS